MRRLAISPLNVMLVLMLAAVAPPQAIGPLSMQQATPAPTQPPDPQPTQVPLGLFQVPEGLEVTLWAASPLLFLFAGKMNIGLALAFAAGLAYLPFSEKTLMVNAYRYGPASSPASAASSR